MMQATQDYIQDLLIPVSLPIDAVENAAQYAEVVLKSEWETVKRGEIAYQSAVRMSKLALNSSFVLLVILVVAVPVTAWYVSRSEQPGDISRSAVAVQAKPSSAPHVQASAVQTSAGAKK
jgi:hypothetical protein